jgi:hypothetical protein
MALRRGSWVIIFLSLSVALLALLPEEYLPGPFGLQTSKCPLFNGNMTAIENLDRPHKNVIEKATLFFGGHIWTGDPKALVVAALLIDDRGSIVCLGEVASCHAKHDEREQRVQLKLHDLKGSFLMPVRGFIILIRLKLLASRS